MRTSTLAHGAPSSNPPSETPSLSRNPTPLTTPPSTSSCLRSKGKEFLYHHFAAEGGDMQSKMALAYKYTRQDMFDKAVNLYAELAEVAVNNFLISKDSPVIEPVRLHNGAEENKEALRKSKGEEDEDFQILEGLRRDHSKALSWFLKAVEKGEPRSVELLGEIYARGAGVERNYTKAFEWLTLASTNFERRNMIDKRHSSPSMVDWVVPLVCLAIVSGVLELTDRGTTDHGDVPVDDVPFHVQSVQVH
ncbi:hypothetical protein V8G54_022670 [Vigna mungo]|uniref:Uncharacterized protein n=1 Tax=Vigna mungo TaxID=3915 RepID=A0AAQ3RRH3_VIGMU